MTSFTVNTKPINIYIFFPERSYILNEKTEKLEDGGG